MQPNITTPEVGMGATIIFWSDRHAATIVRVKGQRVWVKKDHAKRTDSNGMSDQQTYEYSPDESAPEICFSLRKNGVYIEKGNNTSPSLAIGYRNHYHDFSF